MKKRKLNLYNLAILLLHIISGVMIVWYYITMWIGLFKGFSVSGLGWIEFFACVIVLGISTAELDNIGSRK